MSYFTVCTFDLENASYQDYQNAYTDLAALGLVRVIVADGGKKVVMPTTTTAGTFTGLNAGSIRDDLRSKVKQAFARRGFKSEIFISVGGDWTWGAATT